MIKVGNSRVSFGLKSFIGSTGAFVGGPNKRVIRGRSIQPQRPTMGALPVYITGQSEQRQTPTANGTAFWNVAGQSEQRQTPSCELSVTITLAATSADILSVKMAWTSTNNTVIDWGDGTVEALSNDVEKQHTYSSTYTGNITITIDYPDRITKLTHEGVGTSGTWDYSVSELEPLTSLLIFKATNANTISGDISALSSTLTELTAEGSNTLSGSINHLTSCTILNVYGNTSISGDIQYLPEGCTRIAVRGNNTLSGNTSNLPSSLTYLRLEGNTTITGDVANIPTGVTLILVRGNNTLNGDIGDTPTGLTYLQIDGSTTVSGDINGIANGVSTLIITGNNTISGNISNCPTSCGYFTITGSNTISGNTSTITTTLTYFNLGGSNTATISIAELTNCTTITVVGNVSGALSDLNASATTLQVSSGGGTLTGALSDMPSTLQTCIFHGTCQVSGDLDDLPAALRRIEFSDCRISDFGGTLANTTTFQNNIIPAASGYGMDSTEVDNWLVALNTNYASYPYTIDLSGNHAAPTATGDAAAASLETKGATVITN